jgi:hypothetical protein
MAGPNCPISMSPSQSTVCDKGNILSRVTMADGGFSMFIMSSQLVKIFKSLFKL